MIVRSYLKSYNPEGVHVTGLGRTCRVDGTWKHPRQLGCAFARKSISVHATLRGLRRGMVENERIAKACKAWSSILVDQDVDLRREVYINRVTQECKVYGRLTVSRPP